MAQIRLKNLTGDTSKINSYVKLVPNNSSSFIYAKLGDSGIIGTVAQSVPRGSSCLINSLNTVMISDVVGLTVSSTAPSNPKIGDLWFW